MRGRRPQFEPPSVARIAAHEAVALALSEPSSAERAAVDLVDGCDPHERAGLVLALLDAGCTAVAAANRTAAASRLDDIAARLADELLTEAVAGRYACDVPTVLTPAQITAKAEGPKRHRVGRSRL
jgi:hypothetical protein